mmetsp:Transcript_34262/g.86295  ORF Transcript_34262/g.86295 Transcript_34262/m.86295 type:complete len:212 (+) Transcript_34262:769-1404(+)
MSCQGCMSQPSTRCPCRAVYSSSAFLSAASRCSSASASTPSPSAAASLSSRSRSSVIASAIAVSAARRRCAFSSAARSSCGYTFTKCFCAAGQSARMSAASGLRVYCRCLESRPFTVRMSSPTSSGNRSPATSTLQRAGSRFVGSYTKATPPLMPAPKFLPVGPRITAVPPVMYSHAWSPVPSTTAEPPLLRTQKRSAAMPEKKPSPDVAP